MQILTLIKKVILEIRMLINWHCQDVPSLLMPCSEEEQQLLRTILEISFQGKTHISILRCHSKFIMSFLLINVSPMHKLRMKIFTSLVCDIIITNLNTSFAPKLSKFKHTHVFYFAL